MGDIGIDPGGSRFHQRYRGVAQRPRGIDDVVDEDTAAPGDVADNVHDLRNTRPFTTLVDDDEIGIEPAGDIPGAYDAPDIRGNDDQILARMVIVNVLHQN